MGTWGAGLYDDDETADLKPTLSVLFGLPIEMEDVARLASGGHTSDLFWLVMADQLERKGLRYGAATDAAIRILTDGSDLERLRNLGMDAADLSKREAGNAALLKRLQSPRPEKPRKTLKKPKPVPVTVGDVVIYPCSERGPVNPYFSDKLLEKVPFFATGWGALQVVDAGFAFDFLPWVGIRRIGRVFETPPSADGLMELPLADVVGYGTLSPYRFKRMGMKVIATHPVDDELPPLPAGHAGGAHCAMHDICVSNRLFNN